MKIDGWHIDGFGLHADHQVTDLPDGLTIVCGPNESGKTTLQHFLVGMLFGFPPINRADHHAALRGGAYGGRLFVRDDDGQPLTIHRGKSRSSIKVTTAEGSPWSGELATLLGGASKDLYQAVFSMHLEDLAELRALSEDEVRDRVFSAGILGAGRSARTALDQLGGQRDALLKPRGRGDRYRLKELRAQLALARAQLEEARRESQALPGLVRQLDALDVRAQTLSASADQLRAEVALLTAVADLWPSWSAATDARHQLDRLGAIAPTSPEHAQRLHLSVERHRAATEAATDAADQLATAKAAATDAGAPMLDAALLDSIDRTVAATDVERERLARIDELAARANHQTRELDADLAVLGPGHDLAWLEARPADATAAADLRVAAGRVADARADRREARQALERLTAELDDEAAALAHAEAALADLPDLSPERALAGLDAANALAALAAQRAAAAHRRTEATARAAAPAPTPTSSSGTATALGGAAAVAALAAAGAVAAGQPLVGVGAVALAVVLGVIALLGRRRATADGASTAAATATVEANALVQLATDELDRIDRELAAPLATLGLDHVPSPTDAATLRAHAERLAASARDAAEQRRRVATDLARHQDRVARLATAATERVEVTSARVAQAEQAWTAWLAANDLPPTLDPAGAAEFLAAIDRARVAARSLAVTRTDLQAEQAAAAAFVEQVGRLAAQVLEPDPTADAVVLVDRLSAHAREERELHRRAVDAAAALERAEVAEGRAARLAADAAAELTASIAAIGASTVDDAIARLERADVAADLRATIDRADAQLDAAVGTAPDRRTRALQLLAEADPTGWAAQLETLRHRLADATDERDRCLHDRATVSHQIDRLVRSADVPTAELAVTDLESQLVDAVREWAALTLAHQAVEGTLAKYQRERQPEVVQRAAILFAQVTGGAYARIEVRDNEVFAIDRAEREVPATALSQGTTEQLYLCMRLALAESYAKTAPLPLLLDDITVNADPGRQQRLSELLATVADGHQVFAFTCHPKVVEQLVGLRPDARVIELEPRHRAATAPTTRVAAAGRPSGDDDRGPRPGFTIIAG